MEERRYSLKEAREILGISERTVHRWIKSGKLKSYKPGRDHQIPESAIREVIEESEVYPKGLEPSLPFEPEPDEARRGTPKWWVDALEKYVEDRIDKYDQEVQDSNSPHFRDPTAATLWVAQVEEEATALRNWIHDHVYPLLPPGEGEGLRRLWGERLALALELFGLPQRLDDAAQRGKRRIAEMRDKPTKLAARRLEKASAEAEQARERLEEWRRAASG